MAETGKKKNGKHSVGKRVLFGVLITLWVVLILGVLGCAGYAWMVAANEYHLNLQLNGSQEMQVEYGTEYVEPGAKASIAGSLLMTQSQNVQVQIIGTVNTDSLGEYEITYSAHHGMEYETICRTVKVVDTQKPVITLVSDPNGYTLPGMPYREEGFHAQDGYDGDLTDLVIREEKDGVVTYTVADSAGNIAQIERIIVYDDPVAPELTLLGAATMTLYAGSPFEDPGCTAADNCDGDITDKITVTGSVDTKTPGTYTLTYTVQDSYKNETSLTRTVQILPKPVVVQPSSPVKPVGGVIYLTFDDGPGAYTQELLDVLAKYQVKATFFVVKTGRVDMLSKIVEGGHSIGIHSITHNYKQIYASEEAFFNDLYGMQEIIRQYTGVTTYLMRFPGGSSNTVSAFNPGIMTRLTTLVEEKGFKYFDWNVSSGDAGGADTADEVYNNVIRGCRNKKTSIVLQHDIKWFSVDAVERIIQWGLENGYTFAALDMNSPGCHHGVNN